MLYFCTIKVNENARCVSIVLFFQTSTVLRAALLYASFGAGVLRQRPVGLYLEGHPHRPPRALTPRVRACRKNIPSWSAACIITPSDLHGSHTSNAQSGQLRCGFRSIQVCQ